EVLAAAEIAADRLRQERDRDDHVLEPVPPEQLDGVLHARLADHRHHRARLIRGEGPEARALSPGHDGCLHCRVSPPAVRTDNAPATRASAILTQKSTSGHCVAGCVTMRKKIAA